MSTTTAAAPLPSSPSPGEVAAALFLPDAEREQVAVGGVRLALHRAGPPAAETRAAGAVPALLLHGLPRTALTFRHLLPELARDRLVLAPDLPGLGESEADGPVDVDDVADVLAALVLHEVDGPVDVVGHDWGGALALALAAARPDLVRRLVLVDSPYRHLDLARGTTQLLAGLPVLPEALLALTGRRGLRRLVAGSWRAEQAPDPDVVAAEVSAYAPAHRRAAMLASYRSGVRPRLRGTVGAALAKPKVDHPGKHYTAGGSPVSVERALVVWGAADPVLPVRVGEAVVRDLGPGVDMVTLPGVGHSPLEEAPDVAVPVVAEFLRLPGDAPTGSDEEEDGEPE